MFGRHKWTLKKLRQETFISVNGPLQLHNVSPWTSHGKESHLMESDLRHRTSKHEKEFYLLESRRAHSAKDKILHVAKFGDVTSKKTTELVTAFIVHDCVSVASHQHCRYAIHSASYVLLWLLREKWDRNSSLQCLFWLRNSDWVIGPSCGVRGAESERATMAHKLIEIHAQAVALGKMLYI